MPTMTGVPMEVEQLIEGSANRSPSLESVRPTSFELRDEPGSYPENDRCESAGTSVIGGLTSPARRW